ncbi:glyoxalase/bleomycin resistance protein /dioxygenase [Candidatus Scalindua japonica]|uniref:Glyoxalase/bleomycin resistance protein /dioxygenase n=1 Tax=Candidatus Scalindua japonica TaxID=1284222 RepID=A0A286TTY0_9BACT|nr:VOC family protein [Candidatus Scalindua japonica]GAX59349.1 glyoxalase/bleomycin resistance protein /dioxygenase [Candidatus Scalindua japonica]
MQIRTKGINHPALYGRNLDETIHFYTEVLGMKLVLRQPNLVDPKLTHLFFSAGNGAFVAFFIPNDDSEIELSKGSEGLGSMQHLAFNLDMPIEEAMDVLDRNRIKFKGPIDRGYECSLYFYDPNGIKLELMTWKTALPPGSNEAEVIARAQKIREKENDYNIEDQHVRQAMNELGFSLD